MGPRDPRWPTTLRLRSWSRTLVGSKRVFAIAFRRSLTRADGNRTPNQSGSRNAAPWEAGRNSPMTAGPDSARDSNAQYALDSIFRFTLCGRRWRAQIGPVATAPVVRADPPLPILHTRPDSSYTEGREVGQASRGTLTIFRRSRRSDIATLQVTDAWPSISRFALDLGYDVKQMPTMKIADISFSVNLSDPIWPRYQKLDQQVPRSAS
jgi:hypothetical protein